MRGYVREGQEVLQAAVAAARTLADAALLAKALERTGALAAFREDLELARAAGAHTVLGEALWELGATLRRQREFERARAVLEESAAIGDRYDLPFVRAPALAHLGDVHSMLDAVDAVDMVRATLTQAREIAIASSDTWGECLTRRIAGDVAQRYGDLGAAKSAYLTSLPLARRLGDQINLGFALVNLSVIANIEGDAGASRDYAVECLRTYHSLGFEHHIPFVLRMLAYAELQLGDTARAGQLAGECLRRNTALGARHQLGRLASHICLAEIALAQNDFTEATRQLQLAEPPYDGDRPFVTPDALALARVRGRLAI
jgi:tetratricopeptide (TPR) repeat protein